MNRHRLAATLFLAVLAAAPLALAQGKPKKKGTQPAASASATATATETAPPPPPPAPEPAAETAPSASAKAELPDTPPAVKSADNSDTTEDPSKTYYFLGARYRGTVIPQFMVNWFVNAGGATFYSNLVALELDIRKDHHSIVPWLGFATYGFGNTLFENNGGGKGPEFPGNWTVVNSSLNAIYLGMDEIWSTQLDEAHHWDFEYGFGFGLGVVFGNLGNNWVHTKTGTQISNDNYVPCQTGDTQTGCNLGDHTNATVAKVGGYQESAGLLGPKPILFPYLAVPQLGVRWKPVKQFEARLGLGFSLTGFWFGISGDYGLEKPVNDDGGGAGDSPKKASGVPGLHGML